MWLNIKFIESLWGEWHKKDCFKETRDLSDAFRICRLNHLQSGNTFKEVSGYDTKLHQEIWEVWSTSSLPLLIDPLWLYPGYDT